MNAWVRRNRWGLILLVPAVVLALAGNSSRLHLFWWNDRPSEPTRTSLGEPAEFRESFYDFQGTWQRDLRFSVTAVEPNATPSTGDGKPLEDPTPKGAMWIAVTMHVEAAPDVVLAGCNLSLLDKDGREVRYRGTTVAMSDLPVRPCEPENAQGPDDGSAAAIARARKTGGRPAAYDVTAFVLAPDGFVPTQARLWWVTPKYISVDLTRRAS